MVKYWREVSNVDKRPNPISERSRRRITEALISLMHQKPFGKISIKEVVEEAGLTRQTFYHKFESKEDVLFQYHEELFSEFIQKLDDTKVTDWEQVVLYFFRFWQSQSDFVELLINNGLVFIMERQYPEFFRDIKRQYLGNTGYSDAETDFIFSFISGALISLMVDWVRSGEVMTTREITQLVVELLNGTALNRTLQSVGMVSESA